MKWEVRIHLRFVLLSRPGRQPRKKIVTGRVRDSLRRKMSVLDLQVSRRKGKQDVVATAVRMTGRTLQQEGIAAGGALVQVEEIYGSRVSGAVHRVSCSA